VGACLLHATTSASVHTAAAPKVQKRGIKNLPGNAPGTLKIKLGCDDDDTRQLL
jgi:hypothetical protein